MQLAQRPFDLELQRPANSRPSIYYHSDDVIFMDARETAPKPEAYRNGLRHRAIFAIKGDLHGRILLHRRAAAKYHSGGPRTNTYCSRPRPGGHASDAAVRRLAPHAWPSHDGDI